MLRACGGRGRGPRLVENAAGRKEHERFAAADRGGQAIMIAKSAIGRNDQRATGRTSEADEQRMLSITCGTGVGGVFRTPPGPAEAPVIGEGSPRGVGGPAAVGSAARQTVRRTRRRVAAGDVAPSSATAGAAETRGSPVRPGSTTMPWPRSAASSRSSSAQQI